MIQIISIQDVLDLGTQRMRSEMVLQGPNGQMVSVPVFPDQAAAIMQLLKAGGQPIQGAPQPEAPAQQVAAQMAPQPAPQPAAPQQPQAAPEQLSPEQLLAQYQQFGGNVPPAPAPDLNSPFAGMDDIETAGLEFEENLPGEQGGYGQF